MIVFSFANTTLSLDVESAESPALHNWQGSTEAIKPAQDLLYSSYGIYGHLIGESSPAIDVHHALFHAMIPNLSPKILEGKAILEAYTPPILPEGKFY